MNVPRLFGLAATGLAAACPGGEAPEGPRTTRTTIESPVATTYTELGDLDAIRRRGRLRILVPSFDESHRALPRDGSPLDAQREAASDFARSLALEPVLVPMTTFRSVFPMLLDGKVDLIAADLIVTDEREDVVGFSLPLDRVREQIVTRASDDELRTESDLAGRTLSTDPSTAFWRTAEELRRRVQGLSLRAHSLESVERLLDQVASGEIDVTILQSNVLESHLRFRGDLRTGFDASAPKNIAWAVRRESVELRDALNRYLKRERLTGVRTRPHIGDLDEIRRRKELRVLLRNNAVSYFLHRGELVGFEYDLAVELARRLGVRLRVVVPPSHDQLFQWLLEGRGDIAAGFLSPSEQQMEGGFAFSDPYHSGPQWVIARADDPIRSLEDLAGRSIVVRKASPYWAPLERLRREGVHFELVEAANDVETEELIFQVGRGEIDLTIAGGPIGDIEPLPEENLRAAFPIGGAVPSAWVVRPNSQQLLAAVNHFFRTERKSTFFNVTYRKYFGTRDRIEDHVAQSAASDEPGTISPYDDLVREYARRYDFDWRLVLAQMYEESRFEPARRSRAGAVGLMQLLPRTAHELGFRNLRDPETSIHAGLRYLAWLRDRFDPSLPFSDRMWFVLAAYNAGLGHVRDAQRLAREIGRDPDRWFEHVESAMLLLSNPQHARRARHGFIRGSEPVRYVRRIRDRYQAYRIHAPAAPLSPLAHRSGDECWTQQRFLVNNPFSCPNIRRIRTSVSWKGRSMETIPIRTSSG